MLEKFRAARFLIDCKASDHLLLPEFKGSTLRGGFGYAFKRVVCTMRDKNCATCLLRESCVYSYVFQTPIPKDSELLEKVPAAPRPFVIEPPLETKRSYRPGDTFQFGLILIGKAIDYLPYFIYTFDKLGQIGIGKGRGKYRLNGIHNRNGEGELTNIYDGETKTLVGDYTVIGLRDEAIDQNWNSRVGLKIETPLRMKYKRRFIDHLEFHVLLRNLLRRVSLLYYFHCSGTLEEDHKVLIAGAESVKIAKSRLSWRDWTRYSSRQNAKMKLGGMVGNIVYEDVPTSFLPLLYLGELVHVGKGATFGLGKYKITVK